MESIIILQFAAGIIVQILIAIALYHMAERRFGTGTTWAVLGMALGPLGLVLFFGYFFWAEGLARIKERSESQRLDKYLKSQAQENGSQHRLAHSAGVDHYLDELLRNNQWDHAEQHIAEKIRQAHEMGDKQNEAIYREQREHVERRRSAAPADPTSC